MSNSTISSKIPIKNRIESLDIIRGVVILGILIININYFSTIAIERMNPITNGDFTGLNKWIWILSLVFVKQKFMTIFAILFGAGIYLMSESNKVKGIKEYLVHFPRMGWLILFGLLHAYLIWDGDILVSYALTGIVVYFFRNLSPKVLILIGVLTIVGANYSNYFSLFNPQPVSEEVSAYWNPSKEAIEQQINQKQIGWIEDTPKRIAVSFRRQTTDFYTFTLWKVMGLMLIGIALMKTKVLTAEKDKKFYIKMFWWSFIVGMIVTLPGFIHYLKSNFDYQVFTTTHLLSFYLSSITLPFAFIALLMLVVKSEKFKLFKKVISRVGKMAFTNYIMQNIIGTLIFFGYGLGLYGKVDRVFLLQLVVAIWIFQIIFSYYWLNKFNFGPLEWCWRCLTYRKILPLTK